MSAPPPRRRGKEIPRLHLSAFTPTADAFHIPPTPSLISPSAVADAHVHAQPVSRARAVVLSAAAAAAAHRHVPVLAVLTPFDLEATQHPDPPPPALTATYDGATPIAPQTEGDPSDDQLESPVRNLRWALQHARVVDIDIRGAITHPDSSLYDGFVNLLAKAIVPNTTPIVLTNVLPPPLDSIAPVVTLVNHPIYATYRHRISLLSLSEKVSVKLLPPTWVPTEPIAQLDEKRAKELREILKLFIVPVLEAFGFERIIFGSSPVAAPAEPSLAENWYKLVLESFRELAVSQDEMDKIFVDNAERVYG